MKPMYWCIENRRISYDNEWNAVIQSGVHCSLWDMDWIHLEMFVDGLDIIHHYLPVWSLRGNHVIQILHTKKQSAKFQQQQSYFLCKHNNSATNYDQHRFQLCMLPTRASNKLNIPVHNEFQCFLSPASLVGNS